MSIPIPITKKGGFLRPHPGLNRVKLIAMEAMRVRIIYAESRILGIET